jgi:hypothetical protein
MKRYEYDPCSLLIFYLFVDIHQTYRHFLSARVSGISQTLFLRIMSQVYYYTTVLLYYCTTVLLYYCTTALLHYCTTALLHYCTTALLYYCTTVLL